MKNVILLGSLLVFTIACNPNSASQSTTASPQAAETTTPAPVEASTFETNITTTGLSVEQETDVQRASEIIKQVVASQEFKDRVLNHTVNGVKTFLNNKGLTNAQIYQKIIDNNVMDLEVEVSPIKSLPGILFRIIAGVKKIMTYMNLFTNLTPAGIAQNLFQMWLGKLGFTIPTGGSTTGSVQSAIANIIGELGKNYL